MIGSVEPVRSFDLIWVCHLNQLDYLIWLGHLIWWAHLIWLAYLS